MYTLIKKMVFRNLNRRCNKQVLSVISAGYMHRYCRASIEE